MRFVGHFQILIFSLFCFVFSIRSYSQTNEIKLNLKLDKLIFNKSTIGKVKRLMGRENCKLNSEKYYLTRATDCFLIHSTDLEYEAKGITFEFRKVKTPLWYPLFFKKSKLNNIVISDSSSIVVNGVLAIGKSTIFDLKSVFGEPSNILNGATFMEYEYGNRDVIFHFNEKGILTEIVMFSKHISRLQI